MAKKPGNHGTDWSAADVNRLRQLAKENTPTRVIGLKLGRTPAAVQQGAITMKIGIQRARRHLADIVAQVEAGEEIVITRWGKAVARLVPAPRGPKRLPSLEGFRGRLARVGTPTAKLLRAERDA